MNNDSPSGELRNPAANSSQVGVHLRPITPRPPISSDINEENDPIEGIQTPSVEVQKTIQVFTEAHSTELKEGVSREYIVSSLQPDTLIYTDGQQNI